MKYEQHQAYSTAHFYNRLNSLNALFYFHHDLKMLFPATASLTRLPQRVLHKVNVLFERVSGNVHPMES
jgi:hypothetical protein